LPSLSFAEFFKLAVGVEPYDYQRQLGERARPPSVLAVPTGAGKTHALIVSWLYQRRELGLAPRRLVYALPMRSLVEQTASVARAVRTRLQLSEEALAIDVLMGGATRAELHGWQEHPERDRILIGTIDMLLSRALNRGYADSRYHWPVACGLLNNDCRWVFDEVQLMQSARVTSAQLDGLRAKLGVVLPCETIWASATLDEQAMLTVDRPQIGEALRLSNEDRAEKALSRRLNAAKTLERVDATGRAAAELPGLLAALLAERHLPGTLSLAVLNRVELAQQTYLALEQRMRKISPAERPEVVLLHSRFRPPERAKHLQSAFPETADGPGRIAQTHDGPGRIVVSTQVVEAGVDVSARLLATETAPFSSIVQRLGRCNRTGEDPHATVLWIDRGELDAKQSAPYAPEDIASAREALLRLVGASLSPTALERIDVPQRRESWEVLRRRDLLDLFDTSPDLSGTDVDVARFIREDDENSVFVFFRALDGLNARQIAAQSPPERDELVSVPRDSLGERTAWVYDPIDDAWKPTRRAHAGATVMLAAGEGGYDPDLGWYAKAKTPVPTLAPTNGEANDAQEDNSDSFTGDTELPKWMSLSEHLARARESAEALIDTLGLDTGAFGAVIDAAALHDIGKAHDAFQAMLRGSVEPDEEAPDDLETTLWAKSAKRRGGRNPRRHFRHELASALALRSLDGALPPLAGERRLVEYLVAAHHGRVRCSIRAAPDERRPPDTTAARFALGVCEGDRLPAMETPYGPLPALTLTLECMELGGEKPSWAEDAYALRDDPQLGPFRLAYLEALVRIADWRASS
jgi:CRISPR-associated endonuclease/helicase Cas3